MREEGRKTLENHLTTIKMNAYSATTVLQPSPTFIQMRVLLPVNDALQEAEAVGSLPLDLLNGLHKLCLCRDLRIKCGRLYGLRILYRFQHTSRQETKLC